MNLLLSLLIMVMFQNDYVAQYAFKEPVVKSDLTYYEKMKQFESLK
jgi:hypothetical protein